MRREWIGTTTFLPAKTLGGVGVQYHENSMAQAGDRAIRGVLRGATSPTILGPGARGSGVAEAPWVIIVIR